jgi:hypothetical protein
MIDATNRSALIKLSNYPQVIELLTKCNSDEIKKLSSTLQWSAALLGNIQKYNGSIFGFLEKIQDVDKEHFKHLIKCPTAFISQLLKTDNTVIDLLNKIELDNRQHLKTMLEWSTTLTALLAKDKTVIEFLVKLSEQDKYDVSEIVNWAPSTVSLFKNNSDFFKFLSTLNKGELEFLGTMFNWSSSTFYQLIDNDKKVVGEYKTHMLSLYRVWDIVQDQEQFFKSYMSVFNAAKKIDYDMLDAFSNGQIDSKFWLLTELDKLGLDLGNVWTLCGWIGSLAYIINNSKNNLKLNHIRSFDIDNRCASLADQLNKTALLDNWKFKASTLDVNSIRYNDYKFATSKSDGTVQYIYESANTVINTSCDHMDRNTWWERIPSGTLVVLQNNNFLEKEEHVNIVTSLGEFKNRYPMHSVLYEGELDCNLYTRYMLIGRK